MNFSTMEVVRCLHPELVLVVKGTYLHGKTVRRIRQEIPVVNYYPDNPYCGVPLSPKQPSALRRDLIEIFKEYSRVFIWEKNLVSKLEGAGVAAAYLPFGVDPEQYRPGETYNVAESAAAPEAVFIGGWRRKRENHLAAIQRHRVGLWGPGWESVARRFQGRHLVNLTPAYGRDCAVLYASAQVSLNIVDDLNMPGHNMRTFEIPASGGVMLSCYTAEQADFFPEGEAAWYYREPGEIDGILEELRQDRKAQERIKAAAMKIAQDHDYKFRAMKLLQEIDA
jgi:hypothetical protein